ncbi:acyl carrier protein, partial [Phytohabitans suffuscus]
TLPLPTTLIYDHPTPHQLATHLQQQLTGGDGFAEEGILSQLERWDPSDDLVDEAARRRVAVRLRLLLERWSGTEQEEERTAAHRELETASADALFDLISTEFGKS